MDQAEFLQLVVAKKRTYSTTVNERLLKLVNEAINDDENTKNTAQLFTECLLNYLVKRKVLTSREKGLFLENTRR